MSDAPKRPSIADVARALREALRPKLPGGVCKRCRQPLSGFVCDECRADEAFIATWRCMTRRAMV